MEKTNEKMNSSGMTSTQKARHILDMCLKLEAERGMTVFCWYSGHTKTVDIKIYYQKWERGEEPDYGCLIYLSADRDRDKFIKCISFLNKLLTG